MRVHLLRFGMMNEISAFVQFWDFTTSNPSIGFLSLALIRFMRDDESPLLLPPSIIFERDLRVPDMFRV